MLYRDSLHVIGPSFCEVDLLSALFDVGTALRDVGAKRDDILDPRRLEIS